MGGQPVKFSLQTFIIGHQVGRAGFDGLEFELKVLDMAFFPLTECSLSEMSYQQSYSYHPSHNHTLLCSALSSYSELVSGYPCHHRCLPVRPELGQIQHLGGSRFIRSLSYHMAVRVRLKVGVLRGAGTAVGE